MIEEIVEAGEKAGIFQDKKWFEAQLPALKRQVKALIAWDSWGMDRMFQIMNGDNELLKQGLKVLRDGTYERELGKDKKKAYWRKAGVVNVSGFSKWEGRYWGWEDREGQMSIPPRLVYKQVTTRISGWKSS